MNELVFNLESSNELWDLIDKRFYHLLLHKFMPNAAIEWWETDLKMKNGTAFRDLRVRNMAFDISTNLAQLERLIDLNTHQLHIYQFDQPVPDTLSLEYLPEANRDKILMQNGLKHIYRCDFEFVTIASNDIDFLNSISANPLFKERIELHKKGQTT